MGHWEQRDSPPPAPRREHDWDVFQKHMFIALLAEDAGKDPLNRKTLGFAEFMLHSLVTVSSIVTSSDLISARLVALSRN